MEKRESMYKMIKQFVMFGLVGASNTLISLAVYYLGVMCGLHYGVANALGFVVGTLNAYFWNNKYVFAKEKGEQRDGKKTLIKTFLSYGLTLGVSTMLLVFWVDICKISDIIAPLLNLLITIPANFLLNKFWTFKQKE